MKNINVLFLLESTLNKLQGVGKSFKKFLIHISVLFLVIRGRRNFTHLGRWSTYDEKSFRRNYDKPFDYAALNSALLEEYVAPKDCFWALDFTYIFKSGAKTYGLAKYWSGEKQRRTKGLEISLLALVDAENKQAYNLDVRQTFGEKESMNTCLSQLKEQKARMKTFSEVIVADGAYASREFMDFIENELEMYLVTHLRKDANLRYIYTGEQKKRGAKKKYDGKVDFKDFSKWEYAGQYKGWQVYTLVVHGYHFKRKLRVVILLDDKGEHKVLASTDTEQGAFEIIRDYVLRFQIEFNFRDAKQHLGLEECQSRQKKRLHTHFNLVMMIMNLCKLMVKDQKVFSLQDIKAQLANAWWIDFIISNLGFDLSLIINNPNYEKICNWGRLRT